ncbi:MAG: hypothetical protein P5686_26465, partial [Limnospira sp. PMC 1254.20]|uniref:hypothetical protein n=1 Tax=Limnospira sp. PMC 1254.20 TaxID=2981052 RepID=UPI0028E14FA9
MSSIINNRVQELLNTEDKNPDAQIEFNALAPPILNSSPSHYGSLLQEYNLIPEERLLLILALAP